METMVAMAAGVAGVAAGVAVGRLILSSILALTFGRHV